MTMHATTLPGLGAHPTYCRQNGCEADFGIVHVCPGSLRKWRKALRGNPPTVSVYLTSLNLGDYGHSERCPFKELPPEVHAKYTRAKQLVAERKKLDEARARERSAEGGGS